MKRRQEAANYHRYGIPDRDLAFASCFAYEGRSGRIGETDGRYLTLATVDNEAKR